MDWAEITERITSTETLSAERLQVELEKLQTIKPDIANELTSYFTRNGKLNSFMQTSLSPSQLREHLLNPGTSLGVWEIVEVIGSGGMGDVYKAKRSDGLYEQIVAIKVIQNSDEDSLERFEQERKRLASLEHSGISRIIDGGATDNGRAFMVMEYVEGHPIDDYIKDEKLTRRQSLSLFCELCAAVSHAHSKLILHRDIKTKNVLVDHEGTVRLIDFGIATSVGGGSDDAGGPITILYAPPEQLLRQSPVVGSDIFSMGVLLHHILTGKPPLRNSDGSVSVDEQSIADADLSAIITHATVYAADERYASATVFAKEVRAYLDTKPVSARNGGSLYRVKKFLRRNAMASTLAAAFIMALSGGLIASVTMANKATREASRANAEAERANAELAQSEWRIKETETGATIAVARADAFQYVFGINEDQDELSERFIEYLNNIPSGEKENNAHMLAAKKWVIGRYFLDRNDYRMAREVFEPWIEEGYGASLLLAYGRNSLGYAYVKLGEEDLAREVFRKAEEYYIETPAKNTIEHAVPMIQVALLSDDVAATKKATDMIELILKIERDPFNRSYLISQTYSLELQQGNWVAAYAALAQHMLFVEEGASGRITGTDTSHLNFASMNLFHRRDLPLAREHLEQAQVITDTIKGESQSLGLIYELRAVLAWIEKDYTKALVQSMQSLEILEKYVGKANDYANVLAKQGIIQADSDEFEAANRTLKELQELPDDITNTWPELLSLYITARQEGINVAQKMYVSASFPRQTMLRQLMPFYFLEELQADGLQL